MQNMINQPEDVAQAMLQKFVMENAAQILASLLVFFIALFVVGSSLTAMKLGVVAAIVKKQKTGIKGLLAARRYTGKVILVRFLQFLVYLPTFIVTSVVFLRLINNGWVPREAFAVSNIIAFPLTAVAYLLLFFAYPHLYLKGLPAAAAVKSSCRFFSQNKIFVINAVIISILLTVALNIIIILLDKLLLQKASVIFSLIMYFSGALYLQLFPFNLFAAKAKQR